MKKEMDNIIVGLDIGTTKICVMVGRKNEHNKYEIIGLGKSDSHGVSRGVVSNIDKTVEAIILATKQAEQTAGIEISEVFVGIAGQHIKSIRHRHSITLPNSEEVIQKEDLQRMFADVFRLKMQPGEKIIHALPQEFTVDGEMGIKDPIGMYGSRMEANFHIITGQISAAQNIEKCIHKAGLKMGGMILEPIASSAAVLSDEDKEAGVCLVDIGGGTTDIAIFYDGIIRHTAVIPFGGNVITDDIKEGCRVMKSQAEKLKVIYGSALASVQKENEMISISGIKGLPPREISMRNLSSIIQARVEEIIDQVNFEIKSSGFAKKLVGGIVLTGGGAQLNHIKHLVEYRTGLDARIGLPIEHLANAREGMIKHPMFSTGIGLIMTGYDEMKSIQKDDEEIIIQPEEKVIEESIMIVTKKEEGIPKENISWGKKLLGNFSQRVEKFLLEGNDVKDFE